MTDLGLEVLQSRDGKSLGSDEYFDIGSYDVSVGAETSIFLRNPYSTWVAHIEDLDTVNTNSELFGPELIMPLQTVECKVVIKPVNENLEALDLVGDSLTPVIDTIGGDVVWKRYEITPSLLGSIQKNKSHMKKLGKKGLR